jgi:uncharacterized membrane protein
MTKPVQDDHVYHIVLFAFRGEKRASDVLEDIERGQKMSGYRILAQAVVERNVQGKVTVHEPGRGGVGGTMGAVAGGLLGLFGGPLAVVVLAIGGGVAGGIAGHFAGRAIPAEDLRKFGDALPPDSSGLVVLAEDTEAERIVGELEGYAVDVVTVTVGDELSGELDTMLAAEMTPTGGAAPASGSTSTTPASGDATTTTTPAATTTSTTTTPAAGGPTSSTTEGSTTPAGTPNP